MNADIINRLASLGYVATEEDHWVIDYTIQKVTNHICNNCNLKEIPDGLRTKAIDMATGEILKIKHSLGLLNVESAINSIKEGDTQVNFINGSTPAEQYIKYIDNLIIDNVDYAKYRKLDWS